MTARIHEAAAGFGSVVNEYERRRPDYPAEAVDRLIQEIEAQRGASVLDLGAGTGKLTRMLAITGVRLVAVEPVEAMRQRLAVVLPDIPVLAGLAAALPLADGTFDAVVCAQAFHWFADEASLAEIQRVLKPRGRLAMLWNTRDVTVPWVSDLGEILDPLQAAIPQETTGEWRRPFSSTDLFGPLHQLRFPHSQTLDADGLVERYASASYVARLPEPERSDVLERVRHLAETHPDLAGRETFELPYVTELHWCSRRDGDETT